MVWFLSRQEIPYTHRMHVILVPVSTELSIGVATFKQVPPPSPARARALDLSQMRAVNLITNVSAFASRVQPFRRCCAMKSTECDIAVGR